MCLSYLGIFFLVNKLVCPSTSDFVIPTVCVRWTRDVLRPEPCHGVQATVTYTGQRPLVDAHLALEKVCGKISLGTYCNRRNKINVCLRRWTQLYFSLNYFPQSNQIKFLISCV